LKRTLVLSVRGSPVIDLNDHNHEFALHNGEGCPVFSHTIGIEWVLLADSLSLLQEGFGLETFSKERISSVIGEAISL
jgi:hypothetical protein